MPKAILLFATACSCLVSCAQRPALFPVNVQGKTGYIDSSGAMIMAPRYYSGSEFREGLAAVREEGYYGYSNSKGELIIAARYDYASAFQNGLAVVYKDAIPSFINTAGETVLPEQTRSCTFVSHNILLLHMASGREGLYDIKKQRFTADTLYSEIGTFNDGLAIVREFTLGKRKDQPRLGVMDSTGQLLVPMGTYTDIKNYAQGYAMIRKGKDDEKGFGVIDRTGKPFFFTQLKPHCWPGDGFSGGLATINLVTVTQKDYQGYMDLKGNIVLDDTTIRFTQPFSDGRAFVKYFDSEGYVMVNTAFKKVGRDSYSFVQGDGFRNGYAVVQQEGNWSIIDTSGRFVVPAKHEEIWLLPGGYFVFLETLPEDKRLYGLGDLKGDTILPAVMQRYDESGFVNGLFHAMVDDAEVYFNTNGKMVWKGETPEKEGLAVFNIDRMNRGYCYAYSTQKTGVEVSSGGWAISRNYPVVMDKKKTAVPGVLQLFLDTTVVDSFAQHYNGYPLYLANASRDTAFFAAQDSRLYMKMQALDKNGAWKDIEYLPSSWCGNSYHTLQLEPGKAWRFTVPAYNGAFATLLRMQVAVKDKTDPKKQSILYSNVIRGSINPGQYWNKPGYRPNGLMDPYID